jgi:hypothetical protein
MLLGGPRWWRPVRCAPRPGPRSQRKSTNSRTWRRRSLEPPLRRTPPRASPSKGAPNQLVSWSIPVGDSNPCFASSRLGRPSSELSTSSSRARTARRDDGQGCVRTTARLVRHLLGAARKRGKALTPQKRDHHRSVVGKVVRWPQESAQLAHDLYEASAGWAALARSSGGGFDFGLLRQTAPGALVARRRVSGRALRRWTAEGEPPS